MTDVMDLESTDEDGRLHLNGIDALTGLPAVPPMTEEEAARRAAGGPPPAEDVGLLRRLWEALKRPFRGLPDDIDPTDVDRRRLGRRPPDRDTGRGPSGRSSSSSPIGVITPAFRPIGA